MEGGEARSYRYSFELSGGPTPDASFLMTLWATRRSAQILEELDLGEFDGKAGESLRKELTDELISLARKYGVLTPYTSFLAMEDQDLNRTDDNFRQAAVRLGLMGETSGLGAVRSRSMRSRDIDSLSLNSRTRYAPEDAEELFDYPEKSSHLMACMGPVMEGGVKCRLKPDMKPSSKLGAENGEMFAGSSKSYGSGPERIPPETIGGRAFFRKGGVLVEGDLSDDELKAAKEVKQFSEEYFRLAAELPPEGLGWLSQGTPLVFRWKGEVYRIEPVTDN
jgi:Ca-activated chloride channel family protein